MLKTGSDRFRQGFGDTQQARGSGVELAGAKPLVRGQKSTYMKLVDC